tara:strand:+ start:352943 stop:353416 length:474 start_codon:yes stop_codon:yes gene_type:complete
MVDVTSKPVTTRVAIATGSVSMDNATAGVIRGGTAQKGDVLSIARIAAIQSTKLTQQLIPLCHAIPIEAVSVRFDWPETNLLRCLVEVRTTAKTGVEMEAMTAVSVACLTVYDMVKSIDRGMTIGPLQLEQKSGGSSGLYQRADFDGSGDTPLTGES